MMNVASESAGSNRRWLTLVAMTGSLSMIMLDSTIIGVALPHIQSSLEMDATTRAWSVNGYLVALASWVALGGRLGDRIGRVAAFRIGMIGFVAASVACALAPTGWAFVAARVAQGLFAATMQPASAAIVIDSFPAQQRGRAMATYAGISLLFLAGGPLIGGVLVEYASWQWCFWLNIPISILSLSLTVALRLRVARGAARRTDWLSALLLCCGIPTLIVGLQEIGLRGIHTAESVLPTLMGAVMLTVFVRRQLCLSEPLIDLRLLRDRGLLGDALVLFLLQAINVGQAIYGSMFLQTVLDFTPLQAGLGSLPLLVPVLIVVHFAGRLYDKRGPRLPLLIGLSFATLGAIIEAAGVYLLSYPTLAVGMFFFGTGCGFAMSPANADALGRVSPQQRGEASGIVQTMRQVGATTGVAAMVIAMHLIPENPSESGELSPVAFALGFSVHIVLAATALICGWFLIHPAVQPSTATT